MDQAIVKKLHPSVAHIYKLFTYSHLPPDKQAVSVKFFELATWMVTTLPSNQEVTVGLRKLLESKDCAVRATVE